MKTTLQILLELLQRQLEKANRQGLGMAEQPITWNDLLNITEEARLEEQFYEEEEFKAEQEARNSIDNH